MINKQEEITPEFNEKICKGIPLIDSSKVSVSTWYLLNEALSCYLSRNNYACLLTITACLEDYLQNLLNKNDKTKLWYLIKMAKNKNIITKEEYEKFHFIRDWRNTYTHQIKEKMIKIRSGITRDRKTRKIISIYNEDSTLTQIVNDYTQLAILALLSYSALNILIEYFQNRYPLLYPKSDINYKYELVKINSIRSTKDAFSYFDIQSNDEIKKSFFNKIIKIKGTKYLFWENPPLFPIFKEYKDKKNYFSYAHDIITKGEIFLTDTPRKPGPRRSRVRTLKSETKLSA